MIPKKTTNMFKLYIKYKEDIKEKLIIKIEKQANIVPATVIKGAKLFISKKLLRLNIFENASVVIFTSLNKTTKKKISKPAQTVIAEKLIIFLLYCIPTVKNKVCKIIVIIIANQSIIFKPK